MINKLFDRLDDWRRLPSYQLEKRVDIFFAIYLPLIFKEHFNETVIDIIPEFPIRVGTFNDDNNLNLSFKADYALFTESKKVYLVELKTDNGSTREKQNEYYNLTIEKGFEKIINGIIDIYKATSYKDKYEKLLKKLICNGSIILKDLEFISTSKYVFNNEPIFIKPTKIADDFGYILTFQNIIKVIEKQDDEFTKRFIKSLKEWIH